MLEHDSHHLCHTWYENVEEEGEFADIIAETCSQRMVNNIDTEN